MQNERQNRTQRIRDLFEEIGPCTTHLLAETCIERGIYGYDDLRKLHLAAIQSECRKALKELTTAGLPFAGPSADLDEDTGAAHWKQPDLWSYADCCLNLDDRTEGIRADYTAYVRLWDFTYEKYGQAPPKLELREVTPA